MSIGQGVASESQSSADNHWDLLRIRYTCLVAAIGIAGIVVCFLAGAWAFHGEANPGQSLNSSLAPIAGVVGTLVGLIAGHTAGAAGREQAERRASDATNKMDLMRDQLTDMKVRIAQMSSAHVE